MTSRRIIFILVACVSAVLLIFLFRHLLATNQGEARGRLPVADYGSEDTRPGSHPRVRTSHAENGQLTKDLPDSWYSSKPVISDMLTGIEQGVALNVELAHDLKLTGGEKKKVSTVLRGLVQSINSKASTTVSDGGPPPKVWVGASALLYRVEGKNIDAEALKRNLRGGLVEALGEGRGAVLFDRIVLAAGGDPLIRGFGTLELEITFKAIGSGDPKLAMVYWDYRVFAGDGSVLSSGTRNGPGLPPGIRDIFGIAEIAEIKENAARPLTD